MSKKRLFRTRTVALVVALTLGAAACTSSTTLGGAAQAPAEGPSAATEVLGEQVVAAPTAVVATDTAPVEPSPVPTEEPVAEESVAEGAGVLSVVFEDGRSWTMPANDCSHTPDARLSTLLMSGQGEGTVEVNIIETWPISGERDLGNSFIATMVDEEDILHVLEAPVDGVIDTGDSISFTSNVHTNIFYAKGDAPATVGTFSCS